MSHLFGESMPSQFARAVVRSNNDPEKLGRVKVEYPWFHGNDNKTPSEWARVCTPYASSENGFWFLPDVGNEVLVFFENNDLDNPIIMGALYNDKHAPPASGVGNDYNVDNENNLKYIKTRSGHMICFDDSSSGAIHIKHSGGSKIILKGNEVTIHTSGKINLGEEAMHPLIFGDLFQQIFNAHTHSIPTGSSGPPATPMTPDMLSQKVKTF